MEPSDVKGYTVLSRRDRHGLGVCLCEIPFHLVSGLALLVMFFFFLQLHKLPLPSPATVWGWADHQESHSNLTIKGFYFLVKN